MNRFTITGLLIILAATATAGSLTPPGAPAPTMKTLDEVEARTPIHAADLPLTINQPGSYYLAENIEIPASIGDGIDITTSSVTLDLNGFALKGPGTGFGSGISCDSNTTGIIVRDGTVLNWPGNGIGLVSKQCTIEKVNARNNSQCGILIFGGSVTDCTSEFNGAEGIIVPVSLTTSLSRVSGCTCNSNGTDGIALSKAGIVTNNNCSDNADDGIQLRGKGNLAENNNCSQNGSEGIQVQSPGTTLINNNCSFNVSAGIRIQDTDCRVTNNNCSGNGTGSPGSGIEIFSSRCTLTQNTCNKNAVNGIEISGDNCRGDDNHCSTNNGEGIFVTIPGKFSMLKNNNCGGNSASGIRVSAPGCSVIRSNCSGNAAHGIVISAPSCRVEENHVVANNAVGLMLTTPPSIAMKNTASGNVLFNYSFAPGSVVGAVVNLLPPGGTIPPGTGPWDNFVY